MNKELFNQITLEFENTKGIISKEGVKLSSQDNKKYIEFTWPEWANLTRVIYNQQFNLKD